MPGEYVDVLVEFIPSTVKVYDYSLAVNVLGVGDMLLSTPITAECIVAPAKLLNREVQFGECFLRCTPTQLFLPTSSVLAQN